MFQDSEQSLSPGLFIQFCNPAWAKVYNELSYGRKAVNERLAWNDDEVRREFISLAGFDPAKIQFAEFDVQHACLNSARELDSALYMADEVEELDGRPALTFAAGWMNGRAWIHGADPVSHPDGEVIHREAKRHALSIGYPDDGAFINGFKQRVELGQFFVA